MNDRPAPDFDAWWDGTGLAGMEMPIDVRQIALEAWQAAAPAARVLMVRDPESEAIDLKTWSQASEDEVNGKRYVGCEYRWFYMGEQA